jgi:DNA-binding response OmpR family regulator
MKPSTHILVVEDDPQVRQVNFLILHGAGYKVDLAEDGQTGWEMLRKTPYDLVVTDNSMPRLRGVQLIKKIRSAGINVPIILSTACLSPSDEADFRGVALEGHLVKPFRVDELLEMVHTVLVNSRQPKIISDMWHAV